MKVNQILILNDILKNIIDNKELKVSTALKFKMLGIVKKLEPTAANFNIIRDETIQKFGTKELDDDGNETGNIFIDSKDEKTLKKFEDAVNPILNSDVEIEGILFKADEVINMDLPADYLVALYDYIVE